ncbi:hypothetical protein JB92DRAFT_2759549 [Gautieria morchelliformis]|nr:hypothetical protein JB92DRAFT_2759549 [Gautieria morchelliformis]
MPGADSHSHQSQHRHPQPLLELNETDVLLYHAPDPLSYWVHDFEWDHVESSSNWRGLMALHVVGMCLAFFILLPVGISLRSVKHRLHCATVVTFNVVTFLSLAAGSLYKKLTGDLYNGSIHGRGGYLVLTLALILAACDAFAFIRRAFVFLGGPDRKNYRVFWRSVVLNQATDSSPEYARLVPEELEEYTQAELQPQDEKYPQESHSRFPGKIDTSCRRSTESDEWVQSALSHRTLVNAPFHNRRDSMASNHSQETFDNLPPLMRVASHDSHDSHDRLRLIFYRSGRIAFATAERSLVILAFVQLLSGLIVYSGICRGNYLNGCMAHLIKGGIFWCYGLLTFSRYLGAWADVGWAWNRLPPRRAQKVPSAEFVESFVIFLYGSTNVWMERFGAAHGSPFTTKQIQHISIAAMFWFAGMLGLALESRTFRKWLSSPAQSIIKPDENVTQPPSYAGSFNPFPALVIGVTGAAMSAHHQTYLFQVQIHALWGFFLTGFAVFRCLTYFFLWLRPPQSVLPSRPPTEAVASFFLAAGGLTFIFSTEQITFAAMRRQMDDMMFFFNLAVTMTCIAFCWLISIIAFKGWVIYRARISSSTL